MFDVGKYTDAFTHLLGAEELATQIQDPTKLADTWTLFGECYLRMDR